MARHYTLYQVDAFTTEKFSGNPAGVITNAAGLSEREMQRIARELNNSETAFIFPPSETPSGAATEAPYDVHVRFFTPTQEVPICGHATVSAHYVRAREKSLGRTRVWQKTGAGILPVDIIPEGDDYKIIMTQGAISFGEILSGEALDTLTTALGIRRADLRAQYPVQIVSTGHSKVMVCIQMACIQDEDLLHRLTPDMAALCELSRRIGCNGYYVFTHGAPDADPLVHGRMFAPAAGIAEDPVTGNANGPLGAYLVHHGLVRHNGEAFDFTIAQGEAIHRAGRMQVHVAIRDNAPTEVQIAGNAVIAFSTELTLD